ncbi:sigma-54-dependent Fis family transcriptional regulator [Aurantivibrio plasticivorans]
MLSGHPVKPVPLNLAESNLAESNHADAINHAHSRFQDESPDLTVLREAAKLINHLDKPETMILGTLRLMSEMLGLNRGRVVLPESDGATLRIQYSYGLTQAEQKRGVYRLGEGITGQVMQTGREAVVQNVDEEAQFVFKAVDRKTLPQQVVAFLAVPINIGTETIGVLAAHRLRMRPRAIKSDLATLAIIATFIAQVIQINRLLDAHTRDLQNENQALKKALSFRASASNILGGSQAFRVALEQVERVADTQVSVLLRGESGTGKERFARLLHSKSARHDKTFLAINCAAIPEHLLESELFGYERGAFTGANSRKLGRFEQACGGTLFLDEIGDLNLELQSKLLRVLEEQTIQRVGGTQDIPINVRVIAASHKNLQQAVNDGGFRLDLFYRLNVFPIYLPALRERDGDIAILSRYFLQQANHEFNRSVGFAEGVLRRLESYPWPGNIRQLENVVKRAVLVAGTKNINIADIESILLQESQIFQPIHHVPPIESPPAAPAPKTTEAYSPSYNSVTESSPAPERMRSYAWVSEDEAQSLLDALRATHGNKTQAATRLGMTPRQFRYRLKKLQLID